MIAFRLRSLMKTTLPLSLLWLDHPHGTPFGPLQSTTRLLHDSRLRSKTRRDPMKMSQGRARKAQLMPMAITLPLSREKSLPQAESSLQCEDEKRL
jgi:hypothetical protein